MPVGYVYTDVVFVIDETAYLTADRFSVVGESPLGEGILAAKRDHFHCGQLPTGARFDASRSRRLGNRSRCFVEFQSDC